MEQEKPEKQPGWPGEGDRRIGGTDQLMDIFNRSVLRSMPSRTESHWFLLGWHSAMGEDPGPGTPEAWGSYLFTRWLRAIEGSFSVMVVIEYILLSVCLAPCCCILAVRCLWYDTVCRLLMKNLIFIFFDLELDAWTWQLSINKTIKVREKMTWLWFWEELSSVS